MDDLHWEFEALRSWLIDSAVPPEQVADYMALLRQMVASIAEGAADLNAGHGRLRISMFPISSLSPYLELEYAFLPAYFMIISVTHHEHNGAVTVTTRVKTTEEFALNYFTTALSRLSSLCARGGNCQQ
jgi:hypothetical protein